MWPFSKRTFVKPFPLAAAKSVWSWRSDHVFASAWTDDGVLHLVHDAPDDYATIGLTTSDYRVTLDVVIESNAKTIEVNIDPQQNHVALERLSIHGEFESVGIYAPIWPGDPTELGTAEIELLEIHRTRSTTLGGDELTLGTIRIERIFSESELSTPEVDRDDAYDHLQIRDDSAILVLGDSRVFGVRIGDRARLEIARETVVFLGTVGVDAEVSGRPGPIHVEDWKVQLCTGRNRVHFTGIAPFRHGLLRRVQRKLSEDGAIIGSYEPINADVIPFDSSKSATTHLDWVRSHADLISQYSSDPGINADARWLSYDSRRRAAPLLTTEGLVLTLMRPLVYGLKLREPFLTWIAVVAIVVSIYSFKTGQGIEIGGGWAAWRRGLLLWGEGFMLPAGLVSLSSSTGDSVLMVAGTGLRVARVFVSIPFAALVLSARARFRLPKFSDGGV